MAIELKVPEAGESITQVQIGQWLKQEGDHVEQDEVVVTIETEKVTQELGAPASGTLTRILVGDGEEAMVGDVIAEMEAGEGAASGDGGTVAADSPAEVSAESATEASTAPAAEPATAREEPPQADGGDAVVMPAAQRLLDQHGLSATQVEATGPGGRVLKEDVERHLAAQGADTGGAARAEADERPAPAKAAPEKAAEPKPAPQSPAPQGPIAGREEEVVAMSPLRRTIASRLVSAQQTAALLTTFNEIDMTNVMALRKQYGDAFQKRYEIKLGFMSFFVKAVVEALKQTPAINAEIRDTSIAYRNYYDIGIAIGGGRGLVVPIIRDAQRLSFAEIEVTIADFARRAQDNKIQLEELQGGTFSITNGGIYGSLLSTPIINPPQSGILGMHAIQERPVAMNGEVVIRPMMYIALTYDHRVVDGREAVTFLRTVKDLVETPTRILLEV